MSCYFIIPYRTHCVFYRTWFNCTNRIQQALQLFFVMLNLFRASFIQMNLTCVWCIFRFIFKFVLPRLFFKLQLSLLLNMQNNDKNYEGTKSEMTEKNKKTKTYSIAKGNLERGHSFLTSAKKVLISDPHLPLPLYPQTSNFGLSTSYSWKSLIGIQHSPIPGYFRNLTQNFNNEINIVTYSFFFAKVHSVYYSHKYNKTDRKANILLPSRFCERLMSPFSVSITELHVNYKRTFRMETV